MELVLRSTWKLLEKDLDRVVSRLPGRDRGLWVTLKGQTQRTAVFSKKYTAECYHISLIESPSGSGKKTDWGRDAKRQNLIVSFGKRAKSNELSIQTTIACSSQILLDSQKEKDKGIVLQVGQLWMRRGEKANVASINSVLLDSQEELIELSNLIPGKRQIKR